MQGVCSIPSRLTAGGERGWFSRDNYCSLVTRPRRRFPRHTRAACLQVVRAEDYAVLGRQIHPVCPREARSPERSEHSFSHGYHRGILSFLHLPIPDSLSSPRHRPVDVVEEANTSGCIRFNGLRIFFFVCRQVR
jgi:hypothetical protein